MISILSSEKTVHIKKEIWTASCHPEQQFPSWRVEGCLSGKSWFEALTMTGFEATAGLLLQIEHLFNSFKHFVNTHIVASPTFLYAGHFSLNCILSYNSFYGRQND